MLERYLPYVSRAFVESPVDQDNPYHNAWLATCRLPDEVLKQIRARFGSFGTINEPGKFAEMTAPWLTPEEATLLGQDFCY